eukprot:802593-Pyramimonas_sp.AAC.1
MNCWKDAFVVAASLCNAGCAMKMPVYLSSTTSANLSPRLSAASSLARTTWSAVRASPNFFGAKAS